MRSLALQRIWYPSESAQSRVCTLSMIEKPEEEGSSQVTTNTLSNVLVSLIASFVEPHVEKWAIHKLKCSLTS